MLHDGEHTPDGWETSELFVNLDDLVDLPQVPETSVESLKTATALADNGMIVVLDALHIQQWPTVEDNPKLMTELVAAVHELVRGVSESAIVAIGLSASEWDRLLRTTAACTDGPQKKWVMGHTMDKGIFSPT